MKEMEREKTRSETARENKEYKHSSAGQNFDFYHYDWQRQRAG